MAELEALMDFVYKGEAGHVNGLSRVTRVSLIPEHFLQSLKFLTSISETGGQIEP